MRCRFAPHFRSSPMLSQFDLGCSFYVICWTGPFSSTAEGPEEFVISPLQSADFNLTSDLQQGSETLHWDVSIISLFGAVAIQEQLFGSKYSFSSILFLNFLLPALLRNVYLHDMYQNTVSRISNISKIVWFCYCC